MYLTVSKKRKETRVYNVREAEAVDNGLLLVLRDSDGCLWRFLYSGIEKIDAVAFIRVLSIDGYSKIDKICDYETFFKNLRPA